MIVRVQIFLFFRNSVIDLFSELLGLRTKKIRAIIESLRGRLVGDRLVEHERCWFSIQASLLVIFLHRCVWIEMIVFGSRAIYLLSACFAQVIIRLLGCFINLCNQSLHFRVKSIYLLMKLVDFFCQSCNSRNEEANLILLQLWSVGCSLLI